MAAIGDVLVTGAYATVTAKYLFTLSIVTLLALITKNLVRSNIGREWMAVRDMDIAAEIIGIKMLPTKLKAFAYSSFLCGIAGALWAFVHTGSVEPLAFDVNRSFQILFMIIIGGLGSIMGAFLALPSSCCCQYSCPMRPTGLVSIFQWISSHTSKRWFSVR